MDGNQSTVTQRGWRQSPAELEQKSTSHSLWELLKEIFSEWRENDAARLAAQLIAIPGVIDTGLFVDIADAVVVGHPDGAAEVVTRA